MTRKAKIKKWIKRILIGIAVLLGLVWAVYDNLVSNSVYYAKYTPHKEGVEPQLMMVIEHLDDIYLPEMKEYKYKFDGMPLVQLFNQYEQQIGYFSTMSSNKEIHYVYSVDEHNNRFYSFNSKFDLVDVADKKNGFKSIDGEVAIGNKIKKEIYNRLKPLIDAQPLPDVNLQWLFDWIYHDKFN